MTKEFSDLVGFLKLLVVSLKTVQRHDRVSGRSLGLTSGSSLTRRWVSTAEETNTSWSEDCCNWAINPPSYEPSSSAAKRCSLREGWE